MCSYTPYNMLILAIMPQVSAHAAIHAPTMAAETLARTKSA
jgi:hypothetical protein